MKKNFEELLSEICVQRSELEWEEIIEQLLQRLELASSRSFARGILILNPDDAMTCSRRIRLVDGGIQDSLQWEGVIYAGRRTKRDEKAVMLLLPFLFGSRVAPNDRQNSFVEYEFVCHSNSTSDWICRGWCVDECHEWSQVQSPNDLYRTEF